MRKQNIFASASGSPTVVRQFMTVIENAKKRSDQKLNDAVSEETLTFYSLSMNPLFLTTLTSGEVALCWSDHDPVRSSSGIEVSRGSSFPFKDNGKAYNVPIPTKEEIATFSSLITDMTSNASIRLLK